MRFYIIILLFLLSCNTGFEPDSKVLLSWTWVQSSGGFAGQTTTPASTGDEIRIEFTTKTYKKYVNSVLEEDLKYSVAEEKSIISNEPVEIITFSNGWRQSYEVTDSTLFLMDECYDCFMHEYKKE